MPSRDKKVVAGLAALLAVVTLAYANHFENAFHFDDSHTIIDNPYIRDLSNLGLIFTDTRTFSTLPPNRGYRPLVTASLALDYALGGGLRPAAFHASTFFWFSLQIVLMYVLFRRICDMARPDPANVWAALFAAALYALHPAVAETVNYVIQRGDVYSTLGVIAGVLIYAAFPQYRKWGLYLLPVALAILSKPPALIFPVILFVYIRLFEENQHVPAMKKCMPALLLTAGLGYLLTAMTPPTFAPTAGPPYAYRITQPLVALRYFRTFFVPTGLTADTDFVAVNSVFERGAWLGFVFIAAIATLAVWCSKRPAWRPTAFGLWWYLLALVPTSIFALSEVENDHRLYFPFVGLALSVSWAIARGIYSRRPIAKPALIAGALGCVVLFTGMLWATRVRNEVWRTDESLWLDVTIKSPRNGRGLMNYGLTQMERGDFRKALDYFNRAAVFNPAYAFLEINRGIANGGLNQDAAAEEHFRRAIALAPNSAECHYFYGRWLRQKGRVPSATAEIERAIEINPDHMPSRYLSMQIYAGGGDWAKLRAIAESTLAKFPSDTTAASFLARASSANTAAAASAQALVTPRTADDYVSLSLVYYQARKFEECIKAAQEALKLQPTYAAAYNNIAAAYAELKNWDRAIEAASAALKLAPDFQLARNNLAWAESQKKLIDQKTPAAAR
jgi:protein O-mannosyl-transferase